MVRILQVIKKTRALLDGREAIGLLPNGQDPQMMSDMELQTCIFNAGVEDIEEVFDTMEIQKTHGSLAALAFAISQTISEQGTSRDSSHVPPRASSDASSIASNSAWNVNPDGAMCQLMTKTQVVHIIAEAVKASLEQPQPSSSNAAVGRSPQDDVAAAVPEKRSVRCKVYDRNSMPAGVRLPGPTIEKIFAGSSEEVTKILQKSPIKEKSDISKGSSLGEIEYTLHSLNVDSFSMSMAPLKVETLGVSDGYSLTIPGISFKVKGQFSSKITISTVETNCAGSYDVVGRNWSIKMNFKFVKDEDRSGRVSLTVVNCDCVKDRVDVLNLKCPGDWFMKLFTHTPRNYVGDQMKHKMSEALEFVIDKSAREVLQTFAIEETKDELEMEKVYPGMDEACILHVCNLTLNHPNLSTLLSTIDTDVSIMLPNTIVTHDSSAVIGKRKRQESDMQAVGIFLQEIRKSIDPTKIARLLKVLDIKQPLVAKKIDEVHKKEIQVHRGSCEKCKHTVM